MAMTSDPVMPSEPRSALERRLAGEQQTFARSLRSLIRRPPVVCSAEVRLAQAVARMREQGVGSLVIVDAAGRPLGVFTQSDLLEVVAANRADPAIGEVMTRDPLALPPHALAYEAALAMLDRRIRHVLVVEDGRLIGVVSERDLFSLQRLGIGELNMEIRLARDVATLARVAEEIRRLARLLVQQGIAAEQLTSFVSVLNDRLTQRVIELLRGRHDWGALSWCWLAFGSEGRFEQTFATDQDNGLLFVSHGSGESAARAQLLPFTREVNHALAECGFPLCKGNVMASNPELCLGLEEWKARIGGWMANAQPQALLDAAIYFDFRPIFGDATLAAALHEWVFERTGRSPLFLRQMAENALQGRPALGRLGGLTTENAPDAPHSINLKLNGVKPFVDAARIYALGAGVSQTSTAERLRAVAVKGRVAPAEAEAMAQAFFVIQALRLRIQAARDVSDENANRIDPDSLNEFELAMLKQAMRAGQKLQARLALDYQL